MLHMQIESSTFHFANNQSCGFLLDFLPLSLLLDTALFRPEWVLNIQEDQKARSECYIAKNILQQCQLH